MTGLQVLLIPICLVGFSLTMAIAARMIKRHQNGGPEPSVADYIELAVIMAVSIGVAGFMLFKTFSAEDRLLVFDAMVFVLMWLAVAGKWTLGNFKVLMNNT